MRVLQDMTTREITHYSFVAMAWIINSYSGSKVGGCLDARGGTLDLDAEQLEPCPWNLRAWPVR